MKTQSISPAFSGKFIIQNKDNRHINYLYNKVSKIVKTNQVTSEFHTDKIVINAYKTQEKNLLHSLKELGIKIFPLVNKK